MPGVDAVLEQVEKRIREQFPSTGAGPRIEFTRQYFSRHVELWVYTLEMKDYGPVKELCGQIAQEKRLDDLDPEVWLLVKTWTGPWPGGGVGRRHPSPT